MMSKKFTIAFATQEERETIYRLRHEIYASELKQHPENETKQLSDPLDSFNEYLVARVQTQIVAFVSITPPGHGRYSVDKYLQRQDLPFPVDDSLYEVRILTVCAGFRNSLAASLLIYAAFRVVEERGGTRIVAIGRSEVMDLYTRVGLEPAGKRFASGAVTYELMSATIAQLREKTLRFASLLRRFRQSADWQMGFPIDTLEPCFHGGAFWNAIDPTFGSLDRHEKIVNADVLDAWFDPSPAVLEALQRHLPWVLRTSPPTDAQGLVAVIADTRRLPRESLLVGAGSSNLIYLALRTFLTPDSRVLLPDPTYGEYAHLLERVIGCHVDRIPLSRTDGYRLAPEVMRERLSQAAYDMIILVNPNNPTGSFLTRQTVEELCVRIPTTTRIWIDEAYIDYLGTDASAEAFAVKSQNVFVCKSLSKGMALSGVRAAYLCGPSSEIGKLRLLTPPWAVSLPAQIAAVAALGDPAYYESRYEETHGLQAHLRDALLKAVPGLDIFAGPANWVLCDLSLTGIDAAEVCHRCRDHGVYLRDVSAMGTKLGRYTIRIAVKNKRDNLRIANVLAHVVEGASRCDSGKPA